MDGGSVRFLLLGPVEARVDDAPVRLSPLERELVATLALASGAVVSVDRLVDVLWGDAPPGSARNRVQTLVSSLRRALGPVATVATVSSGYRLDLRPGQLDLAEFEAATAHARELADAGGRADAATRLRGALALWRGDPLEGVSGHDADKARLHELRLAALDERLALDLALGRHRDLIGELTALTTAYPTREPFAAKLMLALYRAGRQADALDVHTHLRTHLARELGLDPSPDVGRLHEQILRRDPALELPTDEGVRRAARPAQLPRDAPHFVGRRAELAALLAGTDAADGRPGTLVISAIDGMAGVGKTALAVRAAHRLTEWYPDGQFFVDLRAHTAGHSPLAPAEALGSLLRSIGVDAERIPATTAERAALWRTELAGRRALIVLDNAFDVDQVQPLLPGTPGCLVIVTARRRLAGLEGARPLVLDVLPPHDSAALFAAIVGERAEREPSAVAEVVELCGHLPLAVRVAAGRLRHRPLWTVEDLATRLRDERRRLAELSTADRTISAAFHLSYRDLDQTQQRMFRLLGLGPGVDVDVRAAACLADLPVRPAEAVLEELLDVNLLQQRLAGRYAFHDLLRDHARARAEAEESGPARRAAVRRLLDHYVHGAASAMDRFAPHEKARRPTVPAPVTPTADFADTAAAVGWLITERANLMAAAVAAADDGWPMQAVRLSMILWRYLDGTGLHTDALALHSAALRAARGSGDRLGEAHALNALGVAYEQLNRYAESVEHHRLALAVYHELGDRGGEGDALNKLGIAYDMLGQFERSLACYRQALNIRRAIGDRAAEAGTLQNLSYACRISGRYAEARGYLMDSLALHRAAGNRAGEGASLFQLGLVGRHLGEYDEALDHYARALDISNDLGDPAGVGNAHNGAGQVLHLRGRYAEALSRYEQALEIRREIGDRRMEALTMVNLGATYAALGRYDEALDHLQRAADQCRRLGQRSIEAEAANGLGIVARLLGRYTEAIDHHEYARDIFRAVSHPLGQAEALNGLGESHLAAGRPDRSIACHTAALSLVEQTGDRYEQARAHLGLARGHTVLGDPARGDKHRRVAQSAHRRLGLLDPPALRS